MISNTYIQQPYKTQPMKSNIFKVICIFLQDTLNNVKGFKIAKSDRKFKPGESYRQNIVNRDDHGDHGKNT